MSKLHDAPEAKLPPVIVTREVPDKTDPVPQTSFNGSPVATSPVSVAARLLVNDRFEKDEVPPVSSMVTVKTGAPPANVGPLNASLKIIFSIFKSSAAGDPVTGKPEMVPEMLLVVFVKAVGVEVLTGI